MSARGTRRDALAAAIGEALDRYDAAINEADRALPTGQALEIIAAVLWLNAYRSGSTAQVYAIDSLGEALGGPLVESLAGDRLKPVDRGMPRAEAVRASFDTPPIKSGAAQDDVVGRLPSTSW